MAYERTLTLGTIIDEFKLDVLSAGENYRKIPLHTLDVNRPGLPLTGFYDHFDTQRLLVIGITEYTYMQSVGTERRREAFDKLFSYPIPALIVTKGLKITEECMSMAQKHGRTILHTHQETSVFMSALIDSLYTHLAPCITRSGVMLEVYGEGILIQGESGVGKSEVAIELIKRGHRLVADDAVEIKVTHRNTLIASSPELIRHYMELRGIGVVDIRRLFGVGAIRESKTIDAIVHLEDWVEGKMYDRLGMDTEYTELLDISVPKFTVPVKPGRNIAVIVEIAAMTNRNRKLGYNAARELSERMDAHFKELEQQAL